MRVRGAEKQAPGAIGEPVEVAGATIRQGDVVVLDADGAVVVERERVEEVLAAALERRSASSVKRGKLQAGELSYDLDGLRGLVESVTEPIHDLARIGHAELLTPKPEESLRFFVDVLGMEEEARDGQSVFLRGWGDYLRYSLKLTESPQAGLGHVALRAWSPEALDRRVAAVEASGRGLGWIDGDVGHGPAYRFTDPDGHVFELYYEAERYEAPEHLRPSWRNQPQRYVGRGAAVKRLDHVNVLAADVRANRTFAQDVLGYRLYERIELDDGTETGAWLSLSIAAHELIYVADAYGATGRLHHLAFWVDTREECLRAADVFVDAGVPIEAAPSKHGVAQGFFLYGFEPGGNRIEVTTGGYFVYDPDFEPITWTAEERARGQYWGVKTIESFHTYGTPDVDRRWPGSITASEYQGNERLGSREGREDGLRSLEEKLQSIGSAVEMARELADRAVRLPGGAGRVLELAGGAGRVARDLRALRPVAPHAGPPDRGPGDDRAPLPPRRQHVRELRGEQGQAARRLQPQRVRDRGRDPVPPGAEPRPARRPPVRAQLGAVPRGDRPVRRRGVEGRADGGQPDGGRELYRFQVQGPTAMQVLEQANGGPLPEIEFFNLGEVTIGGRTVRALHHGMSGVPGLELWGPWAEREDVRGAIVEAGQDFGLRQVGSRAYATNTLESGWIPCPLPAVFTGEELKAYREWLPADGYEGTGSLGGSFYADDITAYYLTPHDLGYWPFVKFDHDFIGREALLELADRPSRKKVTLAWNGDDVAQAVGSLFDKGDPAKYIDIPLSNYSTGPTTACSGAVTRSACRRSRGTATTSARTSRSRWSTSTWRSGRS